MGASAAGGRDHGCAIVSGVSLPPEDLDRYRAASLEHLAVMLSRAAVVDIDLRALQSRQFDGLPTIPHVDVGAETRQLGFALLRFDDWVADIAAMARAVDAAGTRLTDPLVGALIAAGMTEFLTPVVLAPPWRTSPVVSSDIVVFEVSAAVGVTAAGVFGFRVDRLADGTVEVTELSEGGIGGETGVGVTATMGLGSTTVGIDLEATVAVLASLVASRTWRVEPDEVDRLIAQRLITAIGVGPLVEPIATAVAAVPESVGVSSDGWGLDLPFTDWELPVVPGFDVDVSLIGMGELAAAGAFLAAALAYEPPAPVRWTVGTAADIEASATASVSGAAEITADGEMDARYESVEYADGSRSDRVSVSFSAGIETPLGDLDGALDIVIDRRFSPDGDLAAVEASWLAASGGGAESHSVRFDVAIPEAGAAADATWDALLDPRRVPEALDILLGGRAIPGVVRTSQDFALDERSYGPAVDLAPLLGSVGVTAEVTVVTLDAR